MFFDERARLNDDPDHFVDQECSVLLGRYGNRDQVY